jgi:hypothetical protein
VEKSTFLLFYLGQKNSIFKNHNLLFNRDKPGQKILIFKNKELLYQPNRKIEFLKIIIYWTGHAGLPTKINI